MNNSTPTQTQYKDKTFNMWMPGGVRAKLDILSKERGTNLTQTILAMIESAFAEVEQNQQVKAE